MNDSLTDSASSKNYYFSVPANAPSFKTKPLTVAIDELQRSIADEVALAGGCEVELSPASLTEWVYKTILSPVDKPNELVAFEGFQFGVAALCQEFNALTALDKALKDIRISQIRKYVSATKLDRPLMGRRTAFLEYALCLEMGEYPQRYPKILAAITVGELLLARLQGRKTDRRLLAKCKMANLEQLSDETKPAPEFKWQLKSQQSCLLNIKEQLALFFQKNQKVARSLGILIVEDSIAAPITDPIKDFNKSLKNRWAASSDHMRIRDRQGTTPLRPVVVREIGGNIRDAVDLDDALAAVQYFEIGFNVTPALTHNIPILRAGESPCTLLSVDIENELVYIGNEWLLKKGAKPPKGTEHLYLDTRSHYPVHLPPTIAAFLKRRQAALTGTPVTKLGPLLKNAQHQPKQNLLGVDSSPGVTVHKIRRAGCTNLVQMGHSRAVVSATTCQNGYISPGRGYYSCISSQMLRNATRDFFISFGWLGCTETLVGNDFFVGSRVTPKKEAIKAAFRIIAAQVDRSDDDFKANPTLGNWLIRHHAICAYFSLVMESGLCYRNKEAYDFSMTELATKGAILHINDKKIRALGGGPGVHKPFLVTQCTEDFYSYLKEATSFLIQEAKLSTTAARIVETLGLVSERPSEGYQIVDFDVHGQTVEIGTSHWHKSLPPFFRLVQNFARHFWPLHLLEAGLNQVHLDYLLRHQLDGAEHETDQDTKSSATVRRELVVVIDSIQASLHLDKPSIFVTGGSHA